MRCDAAMMRSCDHAPTHVHAHAHAHASVGANFCGLPRVTPLEYHSVDHNPYVVSSCNTEAAQHGFPSNVMNHYRQHALQFLQQQADASYDSVVATHEITSTCNHIMSWIPS